MWNEPCCLYRSNESGLYSVYCPLGYLKIHSTIQFQLLALLILVFFFDVYSGATIYFFSEILLWTLLLEILWFLDIGFILFLRYFTKTAIHIRMFKKLLSSERFPAKHLESLKAAIFIDLAKVLGPAVCLTSILIGNASIGYQWSKQYIKNYIG